MNTQLQYGEIRLWGPRGGRNTGSLGICFTLGVPIVGTFSTMGNQSLGAAGPSVSLPLLQGLT